MSGVDDHTLDPKVDVQSESLKAPMAYDATTKHRKVHTHVREDPSDSSSTHVTVDVDNRYPKPHEAAGLVKIGPL